MNRALRFCLLITGVATLASCVSPKLSPPRENHAYVEAVYALPQAEVRAAMETAAALLPVSETGSFRQDSALHYRSTIPGLEANLAVRLSEDSLGTRVLITSDYTVQRGQAFHHLPISMLFKADSLLKPCVSRVVPQAVRQIGTGSCFTERAGDCSQVDSAGAQMILVEKQPELIGGMAAFQKRVKYPGDVQNAGIAGLVVVRFVVNEEGGVECAEVISGLPEGLNESVLDALAATRFTPGTHEGKPVQVAMLLPVTFREFHF